jgi:hypothetical protein
VSADCAVERGENFLDLLARNATMDREMGIGEPVHRQVHRPREGDRNTTIHRFLRLTQIILDRINMIDIYHRGHGETVLTGMDRIGRKIEFGTAVL